MPCVCAVSVCCALVRLSTGRVVRLPASLGASSRYNRWSAFFDAWRGRGDHQQETAEFVFRVTAYLVAPCCSLNMAQQRMVLPALKTGVRKRLQVHANIRDNSAYASYHARSTAFWRSQKKILREKHVRLSEMGNWSSLVARRSCRSLLPINCLLKNGTPFFLRKLPNIVPLIRTKTPPKRSRPRLSGAERDLPRPAPDWDDRGISLSVRLSLLHNLILKP